MAIVMDSDRDRKGKRLNQTKLRIRREFEATTGFVWITAGREIENYVPGDLVREAMHACHRNVVSLPAFGQFARVSRYKGEVKRRGEETARRTEMGIDKLKVAHYVASRDANLDALDLRKNVEALVAFIRQANGIE